MVIVVDANRKEHNKKLSTQDGYKYLLSGFVVAFLKDTDDVESTDFESLKHGGRYTVDDASELQHESSIQHYGLEAGFSLPPQDAKAHTADNLMKQFMCLMSSAPSFQLTTPPKVSCRLWVGDKTVFSSQAPMFVAFDAKV